MILRFSTTPISPRFYGLDIQCRLEEIDYAILISEFISDLRRESRVLIVVLACDFKETIILRGKSDVSTFRQQTQNYKYIAALGRQHVSDI